ncbi:F-box/kelch-repeat protein At4g39560-like [Raphanus sativus]|uniref:F-box/kelch-repeat protein At4g39560-like n=1 Tax=Raphanus sativus TaxID=3726 RepID=A0A6J0MCF7_RAPSA|nr:F-box/kelch-repeat protein At4g39560-like [Raphanus sativus]XP_056855490.1 F-box/kelch-repeat protein At4g39560-like [Raphanus sativus]
MKNPCNAEEEPSRTKKLKLSFSSPSGLSMLPDEMALSCLARVSRSDHASLSLLSKWHRSVVGSPELYDFRSLLGFTENRIYLCLRIPPDPNHRWFTLSPKTPLNRRLVPVRSYFYQPPEASCMVAHGCGIYIMGGRIGGRATSSVLFLDCRSHTWSTLPSMGMARYSAVAGVVDGKIYVLGGCDGWESGKWGEVFDPRQQTWDALPMPPPQCDYPLVCESIVIEEEKLVVMNGSGVCLSYKPSDGKWKKGYSDISGIKRCWHVIENVVYCSLSGGRILWCEPSELEWNEKMEWGEVMGLEALRDTLAASKLVNYGGRVSDQWEICRRSEQMLGTMENDEIFPGHKLSNSGPNMLIFWDVLAPHKLEIWCAEISLERRKKTCEIIGNIVWSEAVMTLDPPPHQHHSSVFLMYWSGDTKYHDLAATPFCT